MKEIIIVLGAPCSGKGTVCNLLKDKIDYKHVSIGEELRKKYPIGSEIRTWIDSGNMADNNIIIDILNDLEHQRILLDGFPRTIEQVEIIKQLNAHISHIFILNVDKPTLIDRMSNRQICNLCQKTEHNNCNGVFTRRQDDTVEIYEQRYQTYINHITYIQQKFDNIHIINNTNISSDNTTSIIYNIINL